MVPSAHFNLVWDEGTVFKETQNVIAPISKEILNKLTVVSMVTKVAIPQEMHTTFTSEKIIGFKNGSIVVQMTASATMTNTWEDYEEFNGLQIAKMHKDSLDAISNYILRIFL